MREVDDVIYNSFLMSSSELYKFIREKEKLKLPIIKEEADWANNFYDYVKNLEEIGALD